MFLNTDFQLSTGSKMWLMGAFCSHPGHLCPRSLSSLFLRPLDFSIYSPAVCRQWWFCFLLFWPCVFGHLALYVDLGRSRLRETRVRALRPAPSSFKGNRLCFCCDSADQGDPSLPGLLGECHNCQWAGIFPAFCNYHVPPSQPKGLPTSSVVATATSLGASFLCQLTPGLIANIQGTNLEGSKLQRLLLVCGEVHVMMATQV